ncbi:DUF1906 domain-containing protein [Streptomyces sp. NPDC050418]|uniref:DUF1906 domain-containing protein n=1 Tax=Streptomyces sp. NPDC050418 TaxID=3365612 RepID=UPI0037B41131
MRTPKLIIGLLALVAVITLTAPASAEHRSSAAPGKTFRGLAFDTCVAPSLRTMAAWRAASPFRGVAVYFGGRGRFCKKQPHLTRTWLREADRTGWSVLPVYVGSQSPCVLVPHKRKYAIGRDPWGQGRKEGRDAVRRAQALGMRESSALYLDMENYSMAKWQCRKPTLHFIRGWNREVRAHGYVPGFYSSLGSGIWHMERARKAGYGDLPSALWYARWNGKPKAHPVPGTSAKRWRGASIHQYRGPKKERYGGRTLEIDRNQVHAPVAVIG